jgi:hypothetical protein
MKLPLDSKSELLNNLRGQNACGGHRFMSIIRENSMTNSSPVHDLRERLETARLSAIEELAAKGGPLPADALQKIALLHSALSAVRDEISIYEVKIGGGSEQPLE